MFMAGNVIIWLLLCAPHVVFAVTLGCHHACEIRDASAHCWGDNTYEQCGHSRIRNHTIHYPDTFAHGPVPHFMGETVSVQAGCSHTCVLSRRGHIACFGDNSRQQLGSNDAHARSVGHNTSASSLHISDWQSCYRLTNGSIVCLNGLPAAMQFLAERNNVDHTSSSSPTPTASTLATASPSASSLATVSTSASAHTSISSSSTVAPTNTIAASHHSSSETPSTTADASHSNTGEASPTSTSTPSGSATLTATTSSSFTPTETSTATITSTTSPSNSIAQPATVEDVAVGNLHVCALISNGSIKCWGDNSLAQLGDVSGVSSNHAAQRPYLQLPPAAKIAAGAHTSCTVLRNGSFACWGENASGQVGTNNVSVLVAPPSVDTIAVAQDIACSRASTCILLTTGTVLCWGANNLGEIGINSSALTVLRKDSQVVVLPGTVAHITAGDGHFCVILHSAPIHCWGMSNDHEIRVVSIGENVFRFPVTLADVGNVTMVYGRDDGTCALMSNHTMKCWGLNTAGQCGIGTNVSRVVPSLSLPSIPPYGNVADVAVGGVQSCIVYVNGSFSCWGYNAGGGLGYNHTRPLFDPVSAGIITLDTPLRKLAIGGKTTPGAAVENAIFGITAGGHLRCWGENSNGICGYGDNLRRSAAMSVGNIPGLV